MPFKAAHMSFVSFAIDITPSGAADVIVVETDLHLNSRHPAYDNDAVQRLIFDGSRSLLMPYQCNILNCTT